MTQSFVLTGSLWPCMYDVCSFMVCLFVLCTITLATFVLGTKYRLSSLDSEKNGVGGGSSKLVWQCFVWRWLARIKDWILQVAYGRERDSNLIFVHQNKAGHSSQTERSTVERLNLSWMILCMHDRWFQRASAFEAILCPLWQRAQSLSWQVYICTALKSQYQNFAHSDLFCTQNRSQQEKISHSYPLHASLTQHQHQLYQLAAGFGTTKMDSPGWQAMAPRGESWHQPIMRCVANNLLRRHMCL